jgi:electron transfer DM13
MAGRRRSTSCGDVGLAQPAVIRTSRTSAILPGMNVIGDLERLFATSLYPLRVPIAVGLILGAIGLIVLARRRGWLATARRHPSRSAALGAMVLVLGLPIAWYLGSPLFIRTELIEPAPAALIESATPSSSPSSDAPATSARPAAATPEPSDAPTPVPTPFAPSVVAVGVFEGADDFHFGEGSASIIETGPGAFTLRFEDFSVRNGPDLYVYLSPDAAGYAEGVVELGTLKATDGAFGYELPDGLEPSDFASAVIWCKQFSVQFAVAPLEAA